MTCSICVDPLDYMVQLPCQHLIHLDCLRRLIVYRERHCPLCRTAFNPVHYQSLQTTLQTPKRMKRVVLFVPM